MKRSVLSIALLGAVTCHAGTFTVTNSNPDGPGSLQAALQQANTEPLGAGSVVNFDAAHFSTPRVIKVTLAGTFYATCSRGVTLEGPPLIGGWPAVIIDGDVDGSGTAGGAGDSGGLSLGSSDAGEHKIMRRIGFYRCGSSSASSRGVRFSGSADFDVLVEDCTFVECAGPALSVEKAGGAATIRRCTFLRNFRVGPGPALSCSLATLVEQCWFEANTATGTSTVEGGAVACSDGGTFRDCFFRGNTANRGGAIRLLSGVLERCTFTENTAQGSFGGAVYHSLGSALLQVRNCTFHGNRSSQNGPALQLDATSEIEHCTFTDNAAYYDATASSAGGGAISIAGSSQTQTVTNCLLADSWNGADRQRTTDVRSNGGWRSGGGNYVSRFDSPATSWFTASDRWGTPAAPLAADLGPLQANGGYTPTRMPGMNAPHVNMAVATTLSTDQRGSQRTSGGNPDAGAVEFRVLNYSQWSDLHPFPSGADGQNDDPDGDGSRNVMEYFLGTDPLIMSPSVLEVSMDSGEMLMTYPVADHVATSLWRAGYQTSQSLGGWNSVSPSVDPLGTSGGVSRFRVRFAAGQDRRFARLFLISTPN